MRFSSTRARDRGGEPDATYGFDAADGPQREDVEITQVTGHGWRVCDRRLPAGDPFRLLGFVEQRPDGFEVLQLGEGFEWHVVDSMESSIAFIVSTAVTMARARLSGDLAWIR